MAVLVGIADGQHLAVRQPDAAGTLDFEEEQRHRIVHPSEHDLVGRALAVADLGARVVRHHAIAVESPAITLALQFRIERAEVHRHQIIRSSVERITEALGLDRASVQQRFVIAGDEALAVAVVAGYLVGDETRLEKRARGSVIGGGKQRGVGAQLAPARIARGHFPAAALQCRPRLRESIVPPTRQFRPRNRLTDAGRARRRADAGSQQTKRSGDNQFIDRFFHARTQDKMDASDIA